MIGDGRQTRVLRVRLVRGFDGCWFYRVLQVPTRFGGSEVRQVRVLGSRVLGFDPNGPATPVEEPSNPRTREPAPVEPSNPRTVEPAPHRRGFSNTHTASASGSAPRTVAIVAVRACFTGMPASLARAAINGRLSLCSRIPPGASMPAMFATAMVRA